MVTVVSYLYYRDIVDQLDHVDDVDVLDKVASNPALQAALESFRPPNGHGTGLAPGLILKVARESGVPVAWVPPSSVLVAVVTAAPEQRMAALQDNERIVLEQCEALLAECSDSWLDDDQTLLQRALEALRDGHHEAAMALAVAVGERLALWASEPRVLAFDSREEATAWRKLQQKQKYQMAATQIAAVGDAPLLGWEVLRQSLIAPIPRFFTPYFAKPDEAVPETVSRHATVHRPTVRHLSRGNALLALMLGTSILREQQSFCEEVRQDDQTAGE